MVVGDLIGEGAAQEETVAGEAPNLAARLQQIAEPGAVVVSEATRRLLWGRFEFDELETPALKGMPGTVRSFRVRGKSPVEGRFETSQFAGPTPLVGRTQELALLLDRWETAKNGEGQVVLLLGEPGIGKSRIALAVRGDSAMSRASASATSARLTTRTPRCGRWSSNSGTRPASAGTTRPMPSSTSSKRWSRASGRTWRRPPLFSRRSWASRASATRRSTSSRRCSGRARSRCCSPISRSSRASSRS